MPKAQTKAVAERYFAALAQRDVEAMVACWAEGGRERIRGQVDTTAPDGVRAFFTELFAAVPDFDLRVEDVTCEGDRVAVRWSASGTFAGDRPFKGLQPNGARIALEGCDVLTVRDGLIVNNDAFSDSMEFARSIGMVPPMGSPAEARMFRAFNRVQGVVRATAAAKALEPVAEGVWLLRGGFPSRTMNVYFVKELDRDGVLMFDAGIKAMTRAVAQAAQSLGGLTRVVLGHGHPDHRGAAPGLGVPVLCHSADKEITEGDGGMSGMRTEELSAVGRRLFPPLLHHWDGGPVPVSDTLEEGDDVAGFTVVHLPGHADGMIALYRERDGVALTSDCFYTIDPQTGIKGPPRVPHRAFNVDTEQARASMRKLASIGPSAAFPGHADGLTGDVRAQLEKAAATT